MDDENSSSITNHAFHEYSKKNYDPGFGMQKNCNGGWNGCVLQTKPDRHFDAIAKLPTCPPFPTEIHHTFFAQKKIDFSLYRAES